MISLKEYFLFSFLVILSLFFCEVSVSSGFKGEGPRIDAHIHVDPPTHIETSSKIDGDLSYRGDPSHSYSQESSSSISNGLSMDSSGVTVGEASPSFDSITSSGSGIDVNAHIDVNSRVDFDPNRTLPTDKYGVPEPDVDAPHSQLGRSKPKYGSEPQARTWDYGSNGQLQPKYDIDFTDHGNPDTHPDVPHKHELTPNNPELAPKGGFKRGGAEPL